MASKTRFVKLDEVDPRGREGSELGGHDGNKRFRDAGSIVVDVAPLDAPGQCEGPGDRNLERTKRELANALILRHDPQPLRGRKRCDTPIAIALIVCRSAPKAGTANRFQAVQI